MGRWVSASLLASPPHTGHQLAFTRERKDSIEMIKLINRSDFFSPRFSFKNVFFFLISISPRFSKNG